MFLPAKIIWADIAEYNTSIFIVASIFSKVIADPVGSWTINCLVIDIAYNALHFKNWITIAVVRLIVW